MIDYGKQRSTVKPEKLELTETKVFISSSIKEVNEPGADEQPGFTGYEFDLIEYDKMSISSYRQRKMLILKMRSHRRRLQCVKSMRC